MIDYNMILSSDLYQRGYDLKALYLNVLAWDYNDILEVIASVKKHKLLILGGDVYHFRKGKVSWTYDGWSYQGDDWKASVQKSLHYINDYHEMNGSRYLYSLVIASPRMTSLRFSKHDEISRRDKKRYGFSRGWSSVRDIGQTFLGQELTQIAYERVEEHYLAVFRDVAKMMSLSEFHISFLEVISSEVLMTYPFLEEGHTLTLEEALSCIQLILQEKIWCKLINPHLEFHFGYDYYAYLYFDGDKERVKAIIKKHQLFWEDRESPYL
ncbi:Imm40 family immunity protein [Streptococcus thoraltensis]|uniref:Imm40 family immunity protein n=1 Tax=Streptococcus thoraltensis TaxID=55085 RepID=UPI001F59BB44|nr:Imm40 family immunity protein [Streptococcus thoraltensis]